MTLEVILAIAATMFSLGAIVGHAAGYMRGESATRARYRRASERVGSPE